MLAKYDPAFTWNECCNLTLCLHQMNPLIRDILGSKAFCFGQLVVNEVSKEKNKKRIFFCLFLFLSGDNFCSKL